MAIQQSGMPHPTAQTCRHRRSPTVSSADGSTLTSFSVDRWLLTGKDRSGGSVLSHADALRLRWFMDELEGQELAQQLDRRHRALLALLGVTPEGQRQSVYEKAIDVEDRLLELRLPWIAKAQQSTKKRRVRNLLDRWKATYGDDKDPEVQARIERTVQAVRNRSQQSKQRSAQARPGKKKPTRRSRRR